MWTVTPLEPFIILLIAHLIGDFVLQSEQMALKKGSVMAWLLLHATELGLITWLLLSFNLQVWPVVLAVFLTHLIFDWMKPRLPGSPLRWYIVDQSAHLLVLWVCSVWMAKNLTETLPLTTYVSFNVQVLIAAYLFVSRPITIGMGLFLRPWLQELTKLKEIDPSLMPVTGLTRSGEWIGNLERFFVLTCILAGQPFLIGFIIVAKAIMRYGEGTQLDQRKRADYVIIGTLGSFWLAATVGFLARHVMAVVGGG